MAQAALRKPLQRVLYATPTLLDLVVFAVCYSHTFELCLQSSNQVISFFSSEASEGLSEVVVPGSDDELGMNDQSLNLWKLLDVR